ncbi:MAG TPA: hypothetical protein VGV89_05800 [Thermoplasmata archaeon]|nr:hypothetical protein [Thermoplasmata archaeon]
MAVGLGFVLGIIVLSLLVGMFPASASLPSRLAHLAPRPASVALPAASASTAQPSVQTPGLTLGISDTPHAVCAYGGTSCNVGVGTTRVTLTAQASPNGLEAWPNVQVAIVVETTSYDGVYDPSAYDPGYDPCASPSTGVCEESNGVPFYVAHAQQIANAIQAANPHSQVSFAMVDYFATLDSFDDGDGSEYHVDIPQFVSASAFGAAVTGSFQATQLGGGYIYSDADLSDNILHSSVITALFGTIIGSGLDWSPDTHHVIVWMGSTVPRDSGYTVNYCVSPSDYSEYASNCYSSGCEPSYTFGTIQSPNCEGWVRSQDGNVTHSIAELAKTSPTCTDSIGGVCTVDVIDLYNGMTDPYSRAWAEDTDIQAGPGTPKVEQDVAKILLAGCDLAAATGGTWDGPDFFACPNGQTGGLTYVPLGSPFSPNTANPSLLAAFRAIGFGPIQTTLVANGTKVPIFQYVPYGNIKIAPSALGGPQWQTVCTLQDGVLWRGGDRCQATPTNLTAGNGLTYYGWNWSSNQSQNALYIGDTWTVSFNVVADGPPYASVPVDACITFACKVVGSQANEGEYTSATYLPVTNHTAITQSFPVATVIVENTPVGAPAFSAPPPPPPVPPPFPIAIPPGIPVISPIGVGAQVGVANVALQATAAGFLAAGFMRVTVKNRPISMAVTAMAGKNKNPTSKFDNALGASKDSGIGRFE